MKALLLFLATSNASIRNETEAANREILPQIFLVESDFTFSPLLGHPGKRVEKVKVSLFEGSSFFVHTDCSNCEIKNGYDPRASLTDHVLTKKKSTLDIKEGKITYHEYQDHFCF